jgi:hypothetical protein
MNFKLQSEEIDRVGGIDKHKNVVKEQATDRRELLELSTDGPPEMEQVGHLFFQGLVCGS